MNTMYRNVKNMSEKTGGYAQVKEKFIGMGGGIISKTYIDSEKSLQNKLYDLIKTGNENEIRSKLEDLKTNLTSLKGELFSEIKNIPNSEAESNIKQSYSEMLGFFDKMPKGGLLHVHSTVGLNTDILLEIIIYWNNEKEIPDDMKIYYLKDEIERDDKTYPTHTLMYKVQFNECGIEDSYIELVTTENRNSLKPFLCFDEPKDWGEFGNIFVRTKSLFLNRNFYLGYYQIFFEQCMHNNIFYVEIRTGFEEFSDFSGGEDIRKGIIFLRPDFNMEDFFYHENMLTDVNPSEPEIEFLRIIKEAEETAIENVRKQHRLRNKADSFKVKVILTANRNVKIEEIDNVLKKMDAAIIIRNNHYDNIPEVIGFDLVSHESEYTGTTEYFSKYIYGNFAGEYDTSVFANKPKCWNNLLGRKRIDLIRFFMHDGESNEKIKKSGEKNNNEEDIKDNAVTGVICSRHRIGHGFKMGQTDNYNTEITDQSQRLMGNLISDYILYGCAADVPNEEETGINYPIIKQGEKYFRKDGIAEPVIEFCPISNQLLGYTIDLSQHPAKTLANGGIFVAVANDDPQIFDNQGLSYDYLMAYINDVLTYEQLEISVFLGYFYREMCDYYYMKDDRSDIWVVNDKMKYGRSGDDLDNQKSTNSDITEYAVLNKAVQCFKNDWIAFANTILNKRL